MFAIFPSIWTTRFINRQNNYNYHSASAVSSVTHKTQLIMFEGISIIHKLNKGGKYYLQRYLFGAILHSLWS